MYQNQFPMPKREIKRIAKITFSLHNKTAIVGYDPKKGKYSSSHYFFQNNYTELPNEFHACPEDTAKILFKMAKEYLSDLLANSEQQIETYHHDGLFVTVIFEDRSTKMYSWQNPIVPTVLKLLNFNEFTYYGEYTHPTFLISQYYCSGVNLQEIRKQIKAGSIPFSAFYNKRVYPMFNWDDYCDAKLVIHPDNTIQIIPVICGHTCPPEEGVEIDSEGNIIRCGKFPYVKALMDNHVKIILDKESITHWGWGGN